jgi:hypothetical protein
MLLTRTPRRHFEIRTLEDRIAPSCGCGSLALNANVNASLGLHGGLAATVNANVGGLSAVVQANVTSTCGCGC